MAEVEPRFINEDSYMRYRTKQDGDIRKEFKRQSNLIKTVRDDLSTAISAANENLRHELSTAFNDKLSDKVGQVKDEVGEIKARLNQMEGRSYNKSRFLPWHNIASIGVYRPNIGFETLEYFRERSTSFGICNSHAKVHNSTTSCIAYITDGTNREEFNLSCPILRYTRL
jgi:hypothetical protein